MAYAQPRIFLKKWDAKTPLGFWDKNVLSILGQTSRPRGSQPKKITCQIVDIVVSADHGAKLKETEKNYKYIHLTREQVKL